MNVTRRESITVERLTWRAGHDTFRSEREEGTTTIHVFRGQRHIGKVQADDHEAGARILIGAQLHEDRQLAEKRRQALGGLP